MIDLRIALLQASLHWEDVGANLAMFEEQIRPLSGGAHVIILPEMFTTGFTMNPGPLAEQMNMRTTRWMRMMADDTGALLIGSFIVRENGLCYNRLVWMEPGGNLQMYDKRHLFRMAGEDRTYAPGGNRLIGTWMGWRICPLICYDLRFPVWSRNRCNLADGSLAYDLLIYVANWPSARAMAWETLLRARAIENLSYVVGVNRTGTDGNGVPYDGRSTAIGPRGDILISSEAVSVPLIIELSATDLQAHRERFPAHLDADDFYLADFN